jgi:hypothetical protein
MQEKTATQLTADLINRDFELEASDQYLTEEELLRMLIDHIDWLLEKRMEWLLSLMYRMDIDERKVHAALLPNAPEPANIGLAKLVLERQKQRVQTKQAYRPDDLGAEWDW